MNLFGVQVSEWEVLILFNAFQRVLPNESISTKLNLFQEFEPGQEIKQHSDAQIFYTRGFIPYFNRRNMHINFPFSFV